MLSAQALPLLTKEAVDDYIAYCKDLGKQPEKPYRGVFNIRISPELHRQAVLEAAKEGVTLNQFVASAVEAQLASVSSSAL